MDSLKWSDAEEIGFCLHTAHPKLDPMTVRFTNLREMVVNLPRFADNPVGSNEKILEAIQMAWLDEYHEGQ